MPRPLFPSPDAVARIAAGLDKASALAPGHGGLDLGGYVTPQGGGATLDLEARINRILSGYASGRIGVASGLFDYEATAGLRARW